MWTSLQPGHTTTHSPITSAYRTSHDNPTLLPNGIMAHKRQIPCRHVAQNAQKLQQMVEQQVQKVILALQYGISWAKGITIQTFLSPITL